MTGPNRLADEIRGKLKDIASQLEAGKLPPAERLTLTKRRKALKLWLQWCETRAGYVHG